MTAYALVGVLGVLCVNLLGAFGRDQFGDYLRLAIASAVHENVRVGAHQVNLYDTAHNTSWGRRLSPFCGSRQIVTPRWYNPE
jgi:hypothetical protein